MNYLITFENDRGMRVSIDRSYFSAFLACDIPLEELKVNSDSDHGRYGPWVYKNSVRTR